jgi:uncharacterized repeat protein (TIGR03806 family)
MLRRILHFFFIAVVTASLVSCGSSSSTEETPGDTTAPTTPTGLTATPNSSTIVAVAWNASTDSGGSGLKDYTLYRDNVAVVTQAGTTFNDTGRTPSTTYSYEVLATDNANNQSARSSAIQATTPVGTTDTTPPSTPTGLAATPTSSTSIAISWNASTDTGGSGLRDYTIYRDNVAVVTQTGTTFNDTGRTPSTTYSYEVLATDNANNQSARSSAAQATTPASSSDTTPPSTPTGLAATPTSSTSITISWNASTDTGGSGLRDYTLYRDNVAIVTQAGRSFTDNGRAPATSYTYEVSATDNANNQSPRSAPVQATTPVAVVSGLDSRPSNTTCIAPARITGSSDVTIDRVFTSLSFSSPVGAFQAPGDNDRWFVVERTGQVRVFSASNPTSASTFLDLTSVITTAGDEEAGLLGLAFHPDFATNGRLYVFYSGPPDSGYRIQSRISEFTSADRLTVNRSTERLLIKANKGESNHNGGQLAFGPNGYLYASLGDGGAGDDPLGNGQSTQTLFGKIIRIDVNSGSPYAIPSTNLYFGNALCPAVTSGFGPSDTSRSPTSCPEIYANGLRNPWRFSFDRGSPTPDLWVGDVGQGAYEEINRVQTNNGNFGWDIKEGPGCHEPSSGCSSAGLTDPIAAAPRSSGFASIIGGYVYRGSAIPALVGRYLFTDFFARGLYLYDAAATNGYTTLLGNTGVMASSFAQDNSGELYLVGYDNGFLYRINPASGSGGGASVPSDLSATGCVNASNPTQPASGLIQYDPNAPFWSDGADKERWMALPNGTNVTIESDGDWTYPSGSVLVKNFRLAGQLIETRLFMRHPDGVWAGYTYQWNGSQTAATRVIGGSTVTYGSQNWIFPSEAQCLQCHTNAAGRSLGLENAQQNGDLLYTLTGRTANQITTLTDISVLPGNTPDPATLPALPDPYDAASGTVAERARAYLHTNCAMCHRPNGGSTVNMDLRYTASMAATATCNVDPSNGDLGVSGAKRIVPADPASSLLYLRMNRRGANQMPPIGSNVIDTEGAALLSQWIQQMDASCN